MAQWPRHRGSHATRRQYRKSQAVTGIASAYFRGLGFVAAVWLASFGSFAGHLALFMLHRKAYQAMSDETKEFWSAQVSSFQRYNDARFYEQKASEHAALIPAEDRALPAVDLGCGAGELLSRFADVVNIQLGLDYSESMLNQARRLMADRDIEFANADVFEFLPTASQPTWTTTGGLNQYLNPDEIARLIGIFAGNDNARGFYLFDTVDPLRYRMVPLGISYLKPSDPVVAGPRAWILKARRFAAKVIAVPGVVAAILSGRSVVRFGDPAMGYGYRPSFWHGLASQYGLDVEMVSSRTYEYRYHVLLRKAGVHGD